MQDAKQEQPSVSEGSTVLVSLYVNAILLGMNHVLPSILDVRLLHRNSIELKHGMDDYQDVLRNRRASQSSN
jgi:hypothetical protein